MDFWKASKEIQQQALDLIGHNHPDLALIAEEIVIIFREKAGKAGGQVILGNPKRVSDLVNALGGTDYKFILEIAADQWENELTSKQREALLDHLLTSCRCEEDPRSGELKLSVARPDIMAFRENVERYGMWFPVSDDESGPSPVEDMFAEESTPGGKPTHDEVGEFVSDLLEAEEI